MKRAPVRHRRIAAPRRIQDVIFIDTNVFTHAVGRAHQFREPARNFLVERNRNGTPPGTSAEVPRELAHACRPVARTRTLDAAMSSIARSRVEGWPLEQEYVTLARQSHEACSP